MMHGNTSLKKWFVVWGLLLRKKWGSVNG